MTDYTELQKAAEYAAQDTIKFADESEEMRALQQFHEEVDPETVLALIAENDRLAANVKLNLCDHPAVHWGDVDLLVASVSGASQIELAKVHGCTPPNISRKIRRVKGRLGWREGMSVVEIRARAEQLRALASQGAVVTADLMAERDQLKAENEALRQEVELDDKLIADRDRLLNLFECPDHGQCIPYAMEQVEALRKALTECADSLHAEMLQKFGGQLPDDMHPVTRREYDRDMAEVSGYRAAMGKGEQS